MRKYVKGDAVRLVNGHSPIMTVAHSVDSMLGETTTCCWFDATSNFRTQSFDADLLKKVEAVT